MRQSIVDRWLLVRRDATGTLLLLIHVNDTELQFSSPAMRSTFLSAWAAEFGEPPAADYSKFFVDTRASASAWG